VYANGSIQPRFNAHHRLEVGFPLGQILDVPDAFGQRVKVDDPNRPIERLDIGILIEAAFTGTIRTRNYPKSWAFGNAHFLLALLSLLALVSSAECLPGNPLAGPKSRLFSRRAFATFLANTAVKSSANVGLLASSAAIRTIRPSESRNSFSRTDRRCAFGFFDCAKTISTMRSDLSSESATCNV
jgi:hypothetical protein